MARTAKAAPVIGLVVFFVGIVLLILTFVYAILAFLNPERIQAFTDLIPASEGEFEGAIKAIGYLVAIALLWVMGSIGGRLTAHGIQMFKSRPSSEGDSGA